MLISMKGQKKMLAYHLQRRHGLNAPGLTRGHAALVALIHRTVKPAGLLLETLATVSRQNGDKTNNSATNFLRQFGDIF